MNEIEIIEQLEYLIEAWQLDEADLNQTDINAIERILDKNKQLKANWDKLKEWLESNWIESQDIWFVKIINKMREIEQGSDSNE